MYRKILRFDRNSRQILINFDISVIVSAINSICMGTGIFQQTVQTKTGQVFVDPRRSRWGLKYMSSVRPSVRANDRGLGTSVRIGQQKKMISQR